MDDASRDRLAPGGRVMWRERRDYASEALQAVQAALETVSRALESVARSEEVKAQVRLQELEALRVARETHAAQVAAAQTPEADLPDEVQHAVQRMALSDAVLRSRLSGWARQRLAAGDSPAMVANQVAMGSDPRTL